MLPLPSCVVKKKRPSEGFPAAVYSLSRELLTQGKHGCRINISYERKELPVKRECVDVYV